MNHEFYSLETLILMHLAGRPTIPGTRELCDAGFLHALATENNQ